MNKKELYKARVIKGKNVGRKIGVPTINLDNPKLKKSLKSGVYIAAVYVNSRKYLGLLYRGPRLLLKNKTISLEVHLLDFNGNLYGKTVLFQILDFVRDVMDFPDIGAYKRQIRKDILEARKFVKIN